MVIKSYKPITPSLRSRRTLKRVDLWSKTPYKSLTVGLTQKGGRNFQGKLCVAHRGGGHKRSYRQVNFHHYQGQVQRIEYDPNRSSSIALLKNDSSYSYILASEGLKTGMVCSSQRLNQIPLGTKIHSIETYPGSGGKLKRAAGTFATLISLDKDIATISLSATKRMSLPSSCLASLGKVSNSDHKNTVRGKAGVSRWLGFKPSVKGIAMNPIDHPHGGKTKRGFLPRTPWGLPTRGKKTHV
jgi:large subunit ribosomal protein L2